MKRFIIFLTALCLLAGAIPGGAESIEVDIAQGLEVPQAEDPAQAGEPVGFEDSLPQLDDLPDLGTEDYLALEDDALQARSAELPEAGDGGEQAVFYQPALQEDVSNDALFEGYVNRLFYPDMRPRSTETAGQYLTGTGLALYSALKKEILKVAEGTRTSTEFSLPIALSAQDRDAVSMALDALWVDCNYELYWWKRFVNAINWSYGGPSSVFYFAVAPEYAGAADYTVDTSKIDAAKQAAQNARGIVDRYAGESDYVKLYAYARAISALVDYNYPAAEDDFDHIQSNPWKLIWVFDGDTETNPVCEGYTHAFQYLCELSSFRGNIECSIVTGVNHAWNLVRMEDGRNYVVDVTWMDEEFDSYADWGTARAISENVGGLFLCGASRGSVSDGYTIDYRNGMSTSFRTYDADTLGVFPASALTLASDKYVLQGWQTIEGKRYYFDASGHYVTGTREIDGVSYAFDNLGVLQGEASGGETPDATGFTYEVLTDGTVSITGCSLSGEVVIPGTIEGRAVSNLKEKLFYGNNSVTGVTIPASVTYFGDDPDDNDWDYVFSYCYKLKYINVASGNPTFCSVDGVLYTKDMSELINYPCSRPGTRFVTPQSVTYLCCTSMARAANLQQVYLSNPETTWATYTFWGDGDLTVCYLAGGYSASRAQRAIDSGNSREQSEDWPTYRAFEGERFFVDDAQEVHAQVTDAAVPATCTDTGLTAGSHCSICNKVFAARTTVPAKGHTAVTDAAVPATCTATGLTAGSHCSVCQAVLEARQVIPMTAHTAVADAAVPATCTDTGLTAGSHCSVCQAVLQAQQVIPMKAHTAATDAAVPATCTATGLTAGSHCSACGKVLEARQVIPMKAHTVATDAAVPATCTATGLTAGSHCSVCQAVLQAQQVIPMKAHTAVADAAVAATCAATGLTAGSHCSVCGTVLVAQTVIPAKGHAPVADAAVAATCTATGLTAGSHCSVCQAVLTAQRVIPMKDHNEVADAAVAATCAATGLTAGSHCSVCGTVLVAQTVIPAKGHAPVADAAVAATCTATGLTAGSHCSVCQAVLEARQVIPMKAHTPVADAAVAATCTATGLTAGSHCSVCQAVLQAQQVIPARGHTPVTDPAVPATTRSMGLTVGSHCSVCGEVLVAQRQTPKLEAAKVTLKGVGSRVTLSPGQKLRLEATVEPAGTRLRWASDNTGVATVDGSGNVAAVGVGEAWISASTDDGGYAGVQVSVAAAPEPTDGPGAGQEAEDDTQLKALSFAVESPLTLVKGGRKKLALTKTPAGAKSAFTWYSADPRVATVSAEGVVEAVEKGETVVTVTGDNGVQAFIAVRVKGPRPKHVYLNFNTIQKLEMGKTMALTASFDPVDAESELTWSSTDERVATVDRNGVVTGVGKGDAHIIVRTENDCAMKLRVRVIAPLPTAVKLDRKSTLKLESGVKLPLKATLSPAGAESKLTWKSSNSDVVYVSSKGVVWARKIGGTATITVKTENGKTAKLKIKVVAPKPTAVTLNKKGTVKLKVGKQLTLKATLKPSKAASKLTWKSSNRAVATVSSKGVVKAKKPGKATITVRTENGKTAKVVIQVVK